MIDFLKRHVPELLLAGLVLLNFWNVFFHWPKKNGLRRKDPP